MLFVDVGIWKKKELFGYMLLILDGCFVVGRMGIGDIVCMLLNEFNVDLFWKGMGEGVVEVGLEFCKDLEFF